MEGRNSSNTSRRADLETDVTVQNNVWVLIRISVNITQSDAVTAQTGKVNDYKPDHQD